MKRNILIYGLIGGVLIVLLRLIEYRFLVVEHSLEIYGGLVAIVFAAVGIWLGLKLTKKEEIVVVREVPVAMRESFVRNEKKLDELGITKRELEILTLNCGRLEQPGNRRTVVRQRKHGQDPLEPAFRQTKRQTTNTGGADGQGVWVDSLERVQGPKSKAHTKE